MTSGAPVAQRQLRGVAGAANPAPSIAGQPWTPSRTRREPAGPVEVVRSLRVLLVAATPAERGGSADDITVRLSPLQGDA